MQLYSHRKKKIKTVIEDKINKKAMKHFSMKHKQMKVVTNIQYFIRESPVGVYEPSQY